MVTPFYLLLSFGFSTVREFFDDVMKSVLDMMGMVTELLKEYSHLIQVHYGMQMGEELKRVKDIFLVSSEIAIVLSIVYISEYYLYAKTILILFNSS